MNLRGIESHIKEIGEALLFCLEHKKRLPLMILIYTTIDILASLTRPKSQEDTSGQVFKDWVKKYLLDKIGVEVTAEDLWGARCGILHTNQPDSRISRQGHARLLEYIQGTPETLARLQQQIDPNKEERIFINLEQLAQALLESIVTFFKDVNNTPELMDRVVCHGDKIFVKMAIQHPKL